MSMKSRLDRLGAAITTPLPKPRCVPVEEWETLDEACERLGIQKAENGFPVLIIGFSAAVVHEEAMPLNI